MENYCIDLIINLSTLSSPCQYFHLELLQIQNLKTLSMERCKKKWKNENMFSLTLKDLVSSSPPKFSEARKYFPGSQFCNSWALSFLFRFKGILRCDFCHFCQIDPKLSQNQPVAPPCCFHTDTCNKLVKNGKKDPIKNIEIQSKSGFPVKSTSASEIKSRSLFYWSPTFYLQ